MTTFINLRDAERIRARRPFLIAHRGGVVAPNAPENSLAAIQLAADQGYRMVELDAVEARDHEPVLFHEWEGTGNMLVNCGIDNRIADLSSQELMLIGYRASDQHIATLEQALSLCQERRLGVMLDIKEPRGGAPSEAFFRRIAELIGGYGFSGFCVTLSTHPLARRYLEGAVVFKVPAEDEARVRRGEKVSLRGQYWFGLPERLPSDLVPKLQQNGAFVVPAINTFRYPPHAHYELAQHDVARLQSAGVDGFQIDSVYRDLFPE